MNATLITDIWSFNLDFWEKAIGWHGLFVSHILVVRLSSFTKCQQWKPKANSFRWFIIHFFLSKMNGRSTPYIKSEKLLYNKKIFLFFYFFGNLVWSAQFMHGLVLWNVKSFCSFMLRSSRASVFTKKKFFLKNTVFCFLWKMMLI